MSAPEDFRVRRIVVALEASGDPGAALEAAAEMAGRLEAELVAVFVEDENLLRSGALPFVRQFSLASARWEAFDSAAMEQEMRRIAAEAEVRLAALAAARRLRHAFRTVRGQVERALQELVEDSDLLVVEGQSRRIVGQVRLPGGARVAAGRSGRSVFVLRAGARPAATPVLLFDGSPAGERAFRAAARLARRDHGRIVVLAHGPEAAGGAHELAASLGLQAEVRPLREVSVAGLCGHAGHEADPVLVVSAADPALADLLDSLMDRASCPVMLVR